MPKPIPEDITISAFQNTYWHRSSLTDFCREKGLPTQGNKADLTTRIAAHLTGASVPKPKCKTRLPMPTEFSLSTVIQPGWHCSQPLRSFFQNHSQTRFHFTKAMRDFIAIGAGKTLSQALTHWEETRTQVNKPIEAQFEYNRFLREFHATHPNTSHAQAIAAWKTHRDTPVSDRTASFE